MNWFERFQRAFGGPPPQPKPKINFGRLIDANIASDARPLIYPQNNLDFANMVTEFDLNLLRSSSRKLFANLGPARSPIIQRSSYSFGQAWEPIFAGDDTEWGKRTTDLLINETLPLCDVRGGNYSFATALALDSISVDRDGDIGIIFTETEDGYPQFRRIMGHRIGSGPGRDFLPPDPILQPMFGLWQAPRLAKGPYRGLRIMQGVIVNELDRPVAYRVFGLNEVVDISARDMMLIYDPDTGDQFRGMPSLTHALNDMLDLMVTQGYEKAASMMAAAIGLVEYNESGTSEDFASMVKSTDPAGAGLPPLSTQTLMGGLIRYFRANGGGKIETIKTDRPGTAWDSFMNRLVRNACAGVPWPYELAWDPSLLSGTNARLILSQAHKSIEGRQGLFTPPAKRMVGYMVAKLVKLGRISPSKDWWRWEFSKPPRLGIDYGRDKKADRDDWQAGISNLTDILEGKTVEEHYRERAHEIALRKKIAKEVSSETGEEISDDEMGIMTNTKPAPAPPPEPGGTVKPVKV